MKNFEEIFRYKTATELKKEYPDYWVLLIKSKKVDCKGVTFSNYVMGTIKVPEDVVLCL